MTPLPPLVVFHCLWLDNPYIVSGALSNGESPLSFGTYFYQLLKKNLGGQKHRRLCPKQDTYFHLLSLAFGGPPLPPSQRKRRLWMAP